MNKITTGLLTIIVPCFNGEKYIERCTKSLDALDDKEVSILFVNDGSFDSSEQKITNWVANHHNAFLINKENGGYSSAINIGLDNCGSEYVMFLGIDDEVVPSGINEILVCLRDKKPDILVFSTNRVFDDDNCALKEEKEPMTRYSIEGFFEKDIFSLCREIKKDAWILFTRDTSRCFKMKTVSDLRYYGKSGVAADGCFSSLVASRANSFEFRNIEGYLWHLHKDSVSAKRKSVYRLLDEATVWKKFFLTIQKSFPERNIPWPIINHIGAYRHVVFTLKNDGEYEKAQEHERIIKQFVKWVYKSRYLSFKARVFLLFPGFYSSLAKILGKK